MGNVLAVQLGDAAIIRGEVSSRLLGGRLNCQLYPEGKQPARIEDQPD